MLLALLTRRITTWREIAAGNQAGSLLSCASCTAMEAAKDTPHQILIILTPERRYIRIIPCAGRRRVYNPSLVPPVLSFNIRTGNVTAAASLAEGCQSCTAGYYCGDTGNTYGTRVICPAGYYCPAGSSSPTGCAAGLYNSLTGSWSSDDCAGEDWRG